jgi:hypothetical protein
MAGFGGYRSGMRSMQALGRLPVGKMNKTEAAYDEHLANLQMTGQILWYKFEGIKLRLADNTFYTADFFVMDADRGLVVHEAKGFMTDDAAVKIKVAAELYPIFRFFLARRRLKKDGGGFSVVEVSRANVD